MTRSTGILVIAILLATVVLAGCQAEAEFTGEFVRYTTLPNGARAAVVKPTAIGASPGEELALTDLTDLESGDLVGLRGVGREWDEPRWLPTLEIVGRVYQ